MNPVVGNALTATTGTWTNAPMSYSFQWQRVDSGGVATNIAGATTSAYTVQGADVGFTLQVAVTAINVYGNTTALSAQTGIVGP